MKYPMYRAACAAAMLSLAMFSGAALADDQSAKKMAKGGSDAKFVMEAAQGGMAEVEMGKLAADKASSPDVKQFGQRMVDDHTKANDQLKTVASTVGVTLPPDVGAKNRALIDQLSKLSGAAFDKAYMQHMVKDHKKDVAEFQKEANSGKNADVKSFASSTLPTLQEHLRMAQDVAGKTGSQSADRMKGSGKTKDAGHDAEHDQTKK